MWKKLIEDLLAKGLKEKEIASRITVKGVRTTQPTINRIKSGAMPSPRYDLGAALIDLHNEVMGTRTKTVKRLEARA
jgi:hypothetical protein